MFARWIKRGAVCIFASMLWPLGVSYASDQLDKGGNRDRQTITIENGQTVRLPWKLTNYPVNVQVSLPGTAVSSIGFIGPMLATFSVVNAPSSDPSYAVYMSSPIAVFNYARTPQASTGVGRCNEVPNVFYFEPVTGNAAGDIDCSLPGGLGDILVVGVETNSQGKPELFFQFRNQNSTYLPVKLYLSTWW